MQQAVDMAELLELTRRDEDTPTVRRVVTPKESGPPVRYATTPFRKYVPPPLPEPEPEGMQRVCWRERFENYGLTIAVAPYMGDDGPRWYARLETPGGRRNFAVCLDRGIWSDGRALLRDRPWDELPDHVDRLASGTPSPPPMPVPAAPPAPATPEEEFLQLCSRKGIVRGDLFRGGPELLGRYREQLVMIYADSWKIGFWRRVPEGGLWSTWPIVNALKQLDEQILYYMALRGEKPPAPPPRGQLF